MSRQSRGVGRLIAPVLSQTAWVSGVTNSQVTGVDLTNLANYGGPGTTSYMYDTQQNFRGAEKAFRLDGVSMPSRAAS